jgi:glycosyltransferase involved in cell wall biosynthesis
MLEALSAGCLVVASKTQPVEEVIQDGVNGLLVDFFSPDAITERVIEVLDHPDRMQSIREQARQTVVENYDLDKLLPNHLSWMQGI